MYRYLSDKWRGTLVHQLRVCHVFIILTEPRISLLRSTLNPFGYDPRLTRPTDSLRLEATKGWQGHSEVYFQKSQERSGVPPLNPSQETEWRTSRVSSNLSVDDNGNTRGQSCDKWHKDPSGFPPITVGRPIEEKSEKDNMSQDRYLTSEILFGTKSWSLIYFDSVREEKLSEVKGVENLFQSLLLIRVFFFSIQ